MPPAAAYVRNLGFSGDTSCADQNVAWRVRKALDLDNIQAGVSPNKNDGIIYDIGNGKSKSGYGHPDLRRQGTQGTLGVAADLKTGTGR